MAVEQATTQATGFCNEPLIDFSRQENRQKMEAALAKVRQAFGREYPMVIGGRPVQTPEKIRSLNPSSPSEVVGIFQKAGAGEVERALLSAWKAFEMWSRTRVEERADLLRRVAGLIRGRRCEFSAWMVYEAGKNWQEADADTAEAIDFCEYYAREALRLAESRPPIELPGERGHLWYLPLGVGVVIPPWNFPGAITVGMTLAAVVTGNTAVLKPSSDAPAIARFFFELLQEAGMPEGVVNFCTGSGADFGEALVAHPQSRFIAFTGSRDAGLHINAVAAEARPGQIWIKRAILEMGGKDAIVVDRTADLGAAVEGAVASAFGFQGQKCSACSRLILDRAIHDEFVERLQSRVAALTVGDAALNPDLGPVINRRALETVLGYIEQGKRDGRLVAGGKRRTDLGEGYFVEPTVFAGIAPGSRLEQEEIFGPVLAVIEAQDFGDALAIANDTEFGLTGAVYSADRAHIELAMREFHAGNLYINRKCTGAMVGAHPFGGFNMSGTDSKAGGPDYLLQFTQAKSIAERK